MNHQQLLQKKIISPITGVYITPKIVEKKVGNKIITELHYIDPKAGVLVSKITLGAN